MRTIRLLLSLTILAIFLNRCSNKENVNEGYEQKIMVLKRTGIENKYEQYKEITQQEQVLLAKKILWKIKWKDAKVEKNRPPDYKFYFQYKGNNAPIAKPVLYAIWITPHKDKLEIVKEYESQYAKLNNNDSSMLFEAITGQKLGE